jgi:pimeloyl-ACP methyl ester carboxylesterase
MSKLTYFLIALVALLAVPTSSESAAGPAGPCGLPKNRVARPIDLAGPGGSAMPGFDVGRGSTFAVLLHQTDNASCGWYPFAAWLAAKHHGRALIFDLCGYGDSTCPDTAFASDQVAQAATAVRWARAHGARRVVVVGASMGGSIALDAAVAVRADAVVDLSGPPRWRLLDITRTAPRLTMPTLIAVSRNDPVASYADLASAFARVPARHKKFVTGAGPHGWELIADATRSTPRWFPLATTVANWIAGRYP